MNSSRSDSTPALLAFLAYQRKYSKKGKIGIFPLRNRSWPCACACGFVCFCQLSQTRFGVETSHVQCAMTAESSLSTCTDFVINLSCQSPAAESVASSGSIQGQGKVPPFASVPMNLINDCHERCKTQPNPDRLVRSGIILFLFSLPLLDWSASKLSPGRCTAVVWFSSTKSL